MASLADPQNRRSPRHITLPCSDLALSLQREHYRSQQALIAWQQRAGPAEPSQGRKPAEPVARSASLDWALLVRQRPSHAIMAGHRPERARQAATLRWVALGILIPDAFFVEAAPRRFARCRSGATQSNVQTNTYDPRRHGATPSLLSCRPEQTAKPSREYLDFRCSPTWVAQERLLDQPCLHSWPCRN